MSFDLEVSKNGKDCIVYNNHKYREAYPLKNGDIVWRCLGKNCKANIKTNQGKNVIFFANEIHTGKHPVTIRTLTPTPAHLKRSPLIAIDTPMTASPSASTPIITSSPTNISDANIVVNCTPNHTTNLLLENTNLKQEIAELRAELKVILDHSVESDQRLLKYTEDIFLPPQSCTENTPDVTHKPCSVTCKAVQTDDPTPEQPKEIHRAITEKDDLIIQLRASIQELEGDVFRLKTEIKNCTCKKNYMNSSKCTMAQSNNYNLVPLTNKFHPLSKNKEYINIEECNRKNTYILRKRDKNGKNGNFKSKATNLSKHCPPFHPEYPQWFLLSDDDVERLVDIKVKFPKNCLFIRPSISHLIKSSGDKTSLNQLYDDLQMGSYDYLILPVNDRINEECEGGTHWSLLVYSSGCGRCYHWDSVRGVNSQHAAKMAAQLQVCLQGTRGGSEGSMSITAVHCRQQVSNKECGIHMVHNIDLVCSLIHNDKPINNSTFYTEYFSVQDNYAQLMSMSQSPHSHTSNVTEGICDKKQSTCDHLQTGNTQFKWVNPRLAKKRHAKRDTARQRTLILGDSMIKHVKAKGCRVLTFPGIRMKQLRAKIANFPEEEKRGVNTVILHVGTNDIHNALAADDILGETLNLIRDTKKYFPGSIIVVNSIISRRDKSKHFVNTVNNNTRWACLDRGAIFNNVSSYITDNCLGRDGLHVNRRGTFLISKNLEYIGNLCCDTGN